MDLAESAAYLRHRLKLGREGALFADDAIDAEFNTEPLGGPVFRGVTRTVADA